MVLYGKPEYLPIFKQIDKYIPRIRNNHLMIRYTQIILALMAMHGSVVTFAQEKNDTLREVVVTGTGTERLLRNAPVQTEVISRKTIES